MNRRLEQMANWLREKRVDFAFISSTANVFYLSNFLCTPHERLLGLAIFPDAEPFLICPEMETSQARRAGWDGQVIGHSDSENPWDLIRQAMQERGITKPGDVAIEKNELSYERAEKLLLLYPEATFSDAGEKLSQLRAVKDEDELGILREAARLADLAVQIGVESITEGKTEMELVAEIEYQMKKKGVAEMAFSTMVLTGANAALPHGTPGNRPIRKGDFVLFDLGVVVDGYCSDITRTVAFDKVDRHQREIYEAVLRAQEAALAKSQPGARIGELDKTARNIITEAGYGDYFPHRIGHGLGIEAHEYPSMSENNENMLNPGMVYTVEPGIYVPEIGGVRIEDDVCITNNGYECLTQYPKQLQIVK